MRNSGIRRRRTTEESLSIGLVTEVVEMRYLLLTYAPGGQELEPFFTAHTVRVRNGRRTVTDAPTVEGEEFLTGYFLIEAESLEAALEWAAKVPNARSGLSRGSASRRGRACQADGCLRFGQRGIGRRRHSLRRSRSLFSDTAWPIVARVGNLIVRELKLRYAERRCPAHSVRPNTAPTLCGPFATGTTSPRVLPPVDHP
jgi:YCII-related domain